MTLLLDACYLYTYADHPHNGCCDCAMGTGQRNAILIPIYTARDCIFRSSSQCAQTKIYIESARSLRSPSSQHRSARGQASKCTSIVPSTPHR
eukprot:6208377-Pleurochrysis_carterae.AAC.2